MVYGNGKTDSNLLYVLYRIMHFVNYCLCSLYYCWVEMCLLRKTTCIYSMAQDLSLAKKSYFPNNGLFSFVNKQTHFTIFVGSAFNDGNQILLR